MILDKEEIISKLQEKVNRKIETLRNEFTQGLFEGLKKDKKIYYVYDKNAKEIVGGPFSTKKSALEYAKDMAEEGDDLVIVDENTLRKKFGIQN